MVLVDNKIIKFQSIEKYKDLKGILPKGNWLLKFDDMVKEFYLEKSDDFVLPSKVYGDSLELSERFLNTYKQGDKNLGVGLAGLKGTGKSLLAKAICVKGDMPVILITDNYSGPDFEAIIHNIKQECIVFIDEFEKIYDEKKDQEAILSVLDGIFTGKKLFLFTSNETSKYSNYLLNRPGRIHYMKTYERISDEMLDDILNDNLDNKSHIAEFKEIINFIEEANIDMVFALIKECNMYKESPKQSVKLLNIRVTNDTPFDVEIKDLKNNCTYEGVYMNNPTILQKYSIQGDMTDVCYESLKREQQDDTKKYPYSKAFVIIQKTAKTQQEGRKVTITTKDFKAVFVPRKNFNYVF